jgi:hypothetical protein
MNFLNSYKYSDKPSFIYVNLSDELDKAFNG